MGGTVRGSVIAPGLLDSYVVIASATKILGDDSESTTVTFAPATAPWGNLANLSKIEFTRTVGEPVLEIIVDHMRTNGRYEMTCIEKGCAGHCSNGFYLNKKGTDTTTINQQFKNANLPTLQKHIKVHHLKVTTTKNITSFFKHKEAKRTTKPILDRMFSAKADVELLIRAQQEWERQESVKKRRREEIDALRVATSAAKRAKTSPAPAASGDEE